MPLSSKLVAQVVATHTAQQDLAIGSVPLNKTLSVALSNGTGAGNADRIFHDQRTLAASANEDLDLAGVLLDSFGAAITFARIKGLYIAAAAANVNNVVVGAAASNAWATLLGATHTLTLRPGAGILLAAGQADATGYAVTAGTGDLLRVANSGAGSSVTYDIIVIGASA
jgi:hypothetical protein